MKALILLALASLVAATGCQSARSRPAELAVSNNPPRMAQAVTRSRDETNLPSTGSASQSRLAANGDADRVSFSPERRGDDWYDSLPGTSLSSLPSPAADDNAPRARRRGRSSYS